MGPFDFLGTPIQTFTRIVYPATYRRNKVQMAVAQVVELKPDGGAVVNVERRSRDTTTVRREIVQLSKVGLQNSVVIG